VTSGVTGRYGATGYNRYDPELPATAGISSPSEPAVTGYDRLPPGTACVVSVWPTCCLLRQRRQVQARPVERSNVLLTFLVAATGVTRRDGSGSALWWKK
jgi:hypothetical protein